MNGIDRLLLDSFERNFGAFRDEGVPIALYGIGIKTQLVLENIKGFNIVGLMDKDTVGSTIYGHPVLSYEEVIQKVKLVIIVANLSVTDLIHQRISFLKDHGIRILRINGSEPATSVEGLRNVTYFENSSNALKIQIDAHDVISFDLFDTLIMRRVVLPGDLFDLVEGVLVNKFGTGFDFKVERIKAEHTCYNEIGEYFNISDVYCKLKRQLNITQTLADEIFEIELMLERENCIPRNAIVSAMEYSVSKGKQVCITTDTYLKREHILSLIKLCGITQFDGVHISSEAKVSKSEGTMWQYFKEIYPDKKILHVGDNPVSDINNAKTAGIDAFEVKSAYELIGISSLNHLLKFFDNFGNRLMLGQFSARMLNDPFVFHKTDGILKINTMYDLGYLSFGPLIVNFMLWLVHSSVEHNIEKLLFFSRDGYVLERLYRKLTTTFGIKAPSSVYFLTSRRAASTAAIFNEEDISFIITKICDTKKVTIGQVLQTAFGVYPDTNDCFLDNYLFEVSKEEVLEYVDLHYSEQILDSSARERENYCRYINSLDILNANRIGCVNYVGRGVTQRCISKIMGKELHGYYFATQSEMLSTLPSLDNVSALYGMLTNLYTETSSIVSKCLFGEVILSAPHEQLISFDRTGAPIFQELKENRDFSAIAECHRGISAYVDDMLKTDSRLLDRCFSADLVESMYDIFSSKNCLLSDNVKNSFVFSDYYDPIQTGTHLFPS